MLLSINGCAVVTTAAVVGGAAVSATTSAVGLTYDATKLIAKGTYTVGEMAVEAVSEPAQSTVQNAAASKPDEIEIHPLKE